MNKLMNIIVVIRKTVSGAFLDYWIELRSKFFMICFLFLLLFLLLKFIPRFENAIYENISPNTVLALWVILIYAYLYTTFLSVLPISVRTYQRIKNVFLRTRSFAFHSSVALSCWLAFQGIFSLFSEQLLYKKFFAALLLQALFVPLFFKLPKSTDVEDFRWFRRHQMSKWKRIIYPFWAAFVILLLMILPIFIVGDIHMLPTLRVGN